MGKWKIDNFDWLFICQVIYLSYLSLIVTPLGKIRLGGRCHSRLLLRLLAFYAICCGNGYRLMFTSGAEPVAYFTGWYKTPLGVEANTAEAAKLASATMCHWASPLGDLWCSCFISPSLPITKVFRYQLFYFLSNTGDRAGGRAISLIFSLY